MRFKTSRRFIVLVTGFLTVVAVSLGTATTQEKPISHPTGSEATIVGTISFIGIPPEPKRVDMSADSICEKLNPDPAVDWVIVTNHNLSDAVIYVRGDSLTAHSFDAPSADVTLEHKACRYVPHVLGMQTQQVLKILNNDPTTHNTHATAKNNPDQNQSQSPGAAPLEMRFGSPELFVLMKCNQHPWERAYVAVFSHPFFSISNRDGSYKISGLPPGQYTVVAWHEELGEQTVEVFLAGSEQKNLDFTFKAVNH